MYESGRAECFAALARNLALTLSLAVAGGCVNAEKELGNGEVAVGDMPAYCSREASAEFGVEPGELELSPIDTAGGIYTINGQYPRGGAKARFQCQFDPNGVFISVVPAAWTG